METTKDNKPKKVKIVTQNRKDSSTVSKEEKIGKTTTKNNEVKIENTGNTNKPNKKSDEKMALIASIIGGLFLASGVGYAMLGKTKKAIAYILISWVVAILIVV